MYTLTANPLVLAGAIKSVSKVSRTLSKNSPISDKYSGAMTVKAPVPSPLHILANSNNPYIPVEKTWTTNPVAHTTTATRQEYNRPKRSFSCKVNRAPNAAPSTLNEVILALRSAKLAGSFFQCDGSRL